MRALVDMTDTQVYELDHLARRVGQSRAALIRAAIDDYLARHRQVQVRDGFGLWENHGVDGLDYQKAARDEW